MLLLFDCFFSSHCDFSGSDSFYEDPDDFLLYLGHFGYSVERLWVLFKSFILAGSSSCLGIAHWSWPAFVGSGSNDNLIFIAFAILSSSAWFIWCCLGSHCSLTGRKLFSQFRLPSACIIGGERDSLLTGKKNASWSKPLVVGSLSPLALPLTYFGGKSLALWEREIAFWPGASCGRIAPRLWETAWFQAQTACCNGIFLVGTPELPCFMSLVGAEESQAHGYK